MLKPDFHFARLEHVPISIFTENGIRCVLLDVDNTLTEDGSPDISNEVGEWIKELRGSGITPYIVSNNGPMRVSAFAEKAGMDYICDAKKPSLNCLDEIREKHGFKNREMAFVGDQLFTDIWFAKRAGMMSVLVDPISPDLPFGVRIKRVLEKPIRPKLR